MPFNYDSDYVREAEYERRAAESDAFLAWCEDNDLPDTEETWDAWEDYKQEAADAHAEEEAERRMEMMAEDDRDYLDSL